MSSTALSEVEKWRSYAFRLIDAGKCATSEMAAVGQRLRDAMRAEWTERAEAEAVRRAQRKVRHPSLPRLVPPLGPEPTPYFARDGRKQAHHAWLGDEKEDGMSYFHHRGMTKALTENS